jgi:nucleolin
VRAEDEAVAVDDEEAPAAPAPEVVSKLYIGNLSWDTQPEDLRQAFEEYGSIIFCDVITDPNGRSRGFGFVEFEDAEQAAAAIDGTNGRDLDGREIRVDYVAARGARPERPPRTGGMKYNNNGHRIYIGNLPWKMDEYDLRDTFEEFGEVSDARVITDRETGRSRGFGFVTMADEADMRNAIQGLDGAECDGRALRVNEAESR